MRIRRERRAKSGVENRLVLSIRPPPDWPESSDLHRIRSSNIGTPTIESSTRPPLELPIRPGKRRERRANPVLGVSVTRQKPSRKPLRLRTVLSDESESSDPQASVIAGASGDDATAKLPLNQFPYLYAEYHRFRLC
jgi:hypothetical protein